MADEERWETGADEKHWPPHPEYPREHAARLRGEEPPDEPEKEYRKRWPRIPDYEDAVPSDHEEDLGLAAGHGVDFSKPPDPDALDAAERRRADDPPELRADRDSSET